MFRIQHYFNALLATVLAAIAVGVTLTAPATHAQETGLVSSGPSLYWEPPTTRQNGEPLALEELEMFQVCTLDTPDTTLCRQPQNFPPSDTSVPIEALASGYGSWYFTIRAVDKEGRQSPWAKPVLGKLLAPPDAPSGLIVK